MKRKVRILYRKLIDSHAIRPWEKYVFDDSYREYQLQVQNIKNFAQYSGFAQMPDEHKNRLNFLVSSSVVGYVQQLNNHIPDVLNGSGQLFLSFTQYRFEIVHSNPTNKNLHKIAINFYSDWLEWVDTISDRMLLSFSSIGDEKLIETLQMQPHVSIYSLKEIKQ